MSRSRAACVLGQQRLRALTALRVVLLLALLPGIEATAAEVLIENLAGAMKFAPLWPGGSFAVSGDGSLAWARVVTDGGGRGAFVANVGPYSPVVDASGKFVKVWVKVDDAEKLGGMEFRLSSDRFSSDFYAFSFPMYEDGDFNVIRDGVWTTLTLSFGSARRVGNPDRTKINSIGWYVADKGGGEPVTAYWGGLALVDEPAEGVVSLTFDDGYDEHHVAAQMMAKYGFRGTAYVIPSAIGKQGYLTLHQLVTMQDSLGWDIAAHHQTSFTEFRPDELETTILGVQRYLVDNGFESGAEHLAYPLGKQNTSAVRPLVRKHFTTARVAVRGPETLPPADPHLLRVLNVTDKMSPEEVGAAARRAHENKEWLILMLHYLVEDPKLTTEYSLADFEKLLEEIAKSKVRVLPMTEVWEACSRAACQLESALAAPAAE